MSCVLAACSAVAGGHGSDTAGGGKQQAARTNQSSPQALKVKGVFNSMQRAKKTAARIADGSCRSCRVAVAQQKGSNTRLFPRARGTDISHLHHHHHHHHAQVLKKATT
jgi:hypothetical protein